MASLERYVKEVEAEREWKEEQTRLHKKHEQVPKDKVIVEKSTAVRSTFSFIKWCIRQIANVIIIALATVGVLVFIYPETRTAFINLFLSLIEQIKNLL